MSDHRTPIERMIDSVVSCTVCGTKGVGNCDCWVTLRCPKCGKRRMTKRDEMDPPGTEVVEFPCPDCNPDGFDHAVRYLDKDGNTIIPEWAKDPTP